MDSKKKRQRLRREELKRKILAAAGELFSQEGYANFSMRRLAAKIEYSPTTIYLHFRNKDDLLFSICEELYGVFVQRMAENRASRAGLLEVLRRSLHSYIEIGLANPEHYKTVFFTSPVVYGPPDEFMNRDTQHRRAYRAFSEMVGECMESGLLRPMDVETLVVVLWSAVHGLVTTIIYSGDFLGADTAAMADSLVEGLLRGYAA